jgi:alkaline phosphatase
VTTLLHDLQARGWKVGTVTSVPFDHVSPAAMYAQDVHRDDYQDLAREMLGLPGIIHQVRHVPSLPGLDVVIGTGFGVATNPKSLAAQGTNGVRGSLFITDADLAAINIKNRASTS